VSAPIFRGTGASLERRTRARDRILRRTKIGLAALVSKHLKISQQTTVDSLQYLRRGAGTDWTALPSHTGRAQRNILKAPAIASPVKSRGAATARPARPSIRASTRDPPSVRQRRPRAHCGDDEGMSLGRLTRFIIRRSLSLSAAAPGRRCCGSGWFCHFPASSTPGRRRSWGRVLGSGKPAVPGRTGVGRLTATATASARDLEPALRAVTRPTAVVAGSGRRW
jgi:hypothetical protein